MCHLKNKEVFGSLLAIFVRVSIWLNTLSQNDKWEEKKDADAGEMWH